MVEHVAPRRMFTVEVAKVVEAKGVDAALRYMRRTYRLAILTRDETTTLNRRNRCFIERERLAGIKMEPRPVARP